MIPYGRQWFDDDDVAAVVEVLEGDWLTQGPTIGRFEAALAEARATLATPSPSPTARPRSTAPLPPPGSGRATWSSRRR